MRKEISQNLEKIQELLNSDISNDYKNLADAWSGAKWTDERWYKSFLANHYLIVSHTEKLICLAAAKTDLVFLRRSMIKHFHDEEAHEEMLVADLLEFGDAMSSAPVHVASRAVYQTMYDDIDRTPESIIGRILALELMATDVIPEIYSKLVESYGAKSATFLKTHAEEDIDHVEKAISGAMKVIEMKPSTRDAIVAQFKQTCWIYSKYLDEL